MAIEFNFQGRTAIVTGASSGIGMDAARRLQAGGASVFAWDLGDCDLPGVTFARVDVTEASSIVNALAVLQETAGPPSILVNSAGIFGPSVPTIDMDTAMWRQVIEVNLTGTYEVCRRVAPLMINEGYGRIVNMASLAGKSGTPNLAAYSAAKAGVIAFTKSFGKEIAKTGVRVNCVAPAAVETPFLDQVSPDAVAIMVAKSPLGRLGAIEEITNQILYLASEECSFNVGAAFDSSGGRAEY